MLDKMLKQNMTARKERDTLTSNLLTTVISEAKMIGKNDGNREPNDAEVMQVIKKFLKGINESILALEKDNRDVANAKAEKAILEDYLPKQLSEEDLKEVILKIVADLPEKSPAMMGKIMGQLKQNYENQFDGKLASKLVKEALV